MTFVSYLYLIYNLITVLAVGTAQRRISAGRDVTKNHTYMVYLIKAEQSAKLYTGWMCGGSLIGRRIVLTSAACVRDVEHMYVIAGYGLYLSENERKSDPCISQMKKKVIAVCVPKDYNLVYGKIEEWAYYDIAVVKVESNIADEREYDKYCHYVPKVIKINFSHIDMQHPGRDALIFGWGHRTFWRQEKDSADLNQNTLQYGATKIYNKTRCKRKYHDFNIDVLIDKYMICTWPPARYNDRGSNEGVDLLKGGEDYGVHDGCNSKEGKHGKGGKNGKGGKDGNNGNNGKGGNKGNGDDGKGGKGGNGNNGGTNGDGDGDSDSDSSDEDSGGDMRMSRELTEDPNVGICQNDHGSPLVSWQRTKLKVIGVASVFKIDAQRRCFGPYLFTSTYCSSKFLKCVISEFEKDDDVNHRAEPKKTTTSTTTESTTVSTTEKWSEENREGYDPRYDYIVWEPRRRNAMSDFCQLPPKEKGFEIIERRISWLNHPDGPADNERYSIRPQVPLQDV